MTALTAHAPGRDEDSAPSRAKADHDESVRRLARRAATEPACQDPLCPTCGSTPPARLEVPA